VDLTTGCIIREMVLYLFRLNHNFRQLLIGGVASNFADGLMLLVLPWFATLLTDDPFLVSLVFASNRLPWLLFAIPAGVISDMFNRRLLIVCMDVLRSCSLGAIFWLAFEPTVALSIWVLIGISFILGCAEVLRDNTAQSFLPQIVEQKDLHRANGQLWSAEKLFGEFIGPPLAGVLIIYMLPLPIGMSCILMAFSAFAIWHIKHDHQPAERVAFLSSLKQGLTFMRQDSKLLRLAIMLSAANFIASGSVALQVLLAQDVLGASSFQYGAVLSVGAFGAISGSFFAPFVARKLGDNPSLYFAILIWIVGYLGIAIAPNLWVMGLCLAMLLCGGMIWNVVTVSWRQKRIPLHIIGRVNGIFRFFGWGSIPLGAASYGVFVKYLDPIIGYETALRCAFGLSAAGSVALFLFAFVKLKLD